MDAMTLLIFPFQFLFALAAVAYFGGFALAFCDGQRWTMWLMQGRRSLFAWVGTAFLIACITSTWVPTDPDPYDCVPSYTGERC